eukprot:11382413-Karenia_brevis.AAC.1
MYPPAPLWGHHCETTSGRNWIPLAGFTRVPDTGPPNPPGANQKQSPKLGDQILDLQLGVNIASRPSNVEPRWLQDS